MKLYIKMCVCSFYSFDFEFIVTRACTFALLKLLTYSVFVLCKAHWTALVYEMCLQIKFPCIMCWGGRASRSLLI